MSSSLVDEVHVVAYLLPVEAEVRIGGEWWCVGMAFNNDTSSGSLTRDVE